MTSLSKKPVTERKLQEKVADHIRKKGLLSSCFTAGTAFMKHQRINLYKMGYSNGTPDMVIFEPRGPYFGLLIEMKTERGKASNAQKGWAFALMQRGYYCAICFSAEEAITIIDDYMGMPMAAISLQMEKERNETNGAVFASESELDGGPPGSRHSCSDGPAPFDGTADQHPAAELCAGAESSQAAQPSDQGHQPVRVPDGCEGPSA